MPFRVPGVMFNNPYQQGHTLEIQADGEITIIAAQKSDGSRGIGDCSIGSNNQTFLSGIHGLTIDSGDGDLSLNTSGGRIMINGTEISQG